MMDCGPMDARLEKIQIDQLEKTAELILRKKHRNGWMTIKYINPFLIDMISILMTN